MAVITDAKNWRGMGRQAEACAEGRPPIDPGLIEAWARGRALVRGTPGPVRDGEAFRCDTGLPHERARYIFPALCSGVKLLAERIVEPRIALKACASASDVAPLLPARWVIQPPGFFMRCIGAMDAARAALPAGYVLETLAEERGGDGRVFVVMIRDARGAPAASGRAGQIGDMLIYDQIETDAAHRRRGLGRIVMKTLESSADGAQGRQLLVATEDGRALYTRLGWSILSPYTTAIIPG